jgi:hypothetical protein
VSVDRLDFRLLQTQLVSHVRDRVRNGEISERGLARLTGFSQPHIHNVLKGARLLSVEVADQILRSLRIDLMDLLPEAGEAPRREATDGAECRMVALLDGCIARRQPYPTATGWEQYPFPAADVGRLESPVAVRFAPDPLRAPLFRGHGVVLLDRSEAIRREPDGEGYFALNLPGGGTLGLVRLVQQDTSLWVRHAESWQSVPIGDRDPLEVIQGRVSLLVRQL